MRIWLNRTGEVSLREQLITQVRLGILCRELNPGDRLPSTRELARRFGIHANTASAAFRELERIGWLEFRHGSGVFVAPTIPAHGVSPELAAMRDARLGARANIDSIDSLIAAMLSQSRDLGLAPALVRERLSLWLATEPPSRWLVVEPEPELRRILIYELEQSLRMPVAGCAPEDLTANPAKFQDAMALAIPNRAETVRRLLPSELPLVTLELHPVAPAIESYLPYPEGSLIAVASRWKEFQRIAQLMLLAVGIPAESLLVRDATLPGWKRGLEQAWVVVCDAVTEPQLPKTRRPIAFRLVSEATLAELRSTEETLQHGLAYPRLPL
jgi:DNA-binding transcriptional regulator YhcF (GntR family)